MVGKRSPKPSMRVRLLLPLYERKAKSLPFLLLWLKFENRKVETIREFFSLHFLMYFTSPRYCFRNSAWTSGTIRKSAFGELIIILHI